MREIGETERSQLQHLAKGADAVARRARIILRSESAEETVASIASALELAPATIRQWQRRFVKHGVAGLSDRKRPGAPRRIGNDLGSAIADLHAEGLGTREIARKTGVSQSSVSRLIRDFAPPPDAADAAPSTALIESLAVKLFESLSDDRPWSEFIDRLRIETGSDYGTFLVFSGHGPKPTVILSDETQLEGLGAYLEEYYAKELFVGVPTGTVATLSDLISREDLRKTDFYKDYLHRYDVGHVLGVDIGNVRGIAGRLRLARLESKEDYGEYERAICKRIVPYLRSALDLFVKRIDTEAEKEALSATVSGMSVGSIIVDPDGHILDANPPARAILAQRDGVFLSGDKVCLSHPDQSRHLHSLIRSNAEASLDRNAPAAVRAILVDRPSGQESISLLVRPAARGGNGKLAIRPTAVLHLVDPAQPRLKVIDALVQLFGLTRTEARVALSLSNGFSINETAEATGTSKNTIRSHVRAIFSKMGVSRQAELIRAVLISVALLALEDTL